MFAAIWAILKFTLAMSIISTFFALGAMVSLLFPKTREAKTAKIARFYCKILSRVIGLRVTLSNTEILEKQSRNFLVISNHHSYLDIFPIFHLLNASFLTSMEVKGHWFLGPVCLYGGCYFVERRSRTTVAKEIDKLKEHLHAGNNLVIFPEGTTGDGTAMLPFKGTLLETAVRAGTPVLPLCIKYKSINGKPVDRSNRDTLYWYGEMEFFPHIFQMLKQRRIDVEIKVLEPISVTDRDRKALATEAYAAINEHFERLPHQP